MKQLKHSHFLLVFSILHKNFLTSSVNCFISSNKSIFKIGKKNVVNKKKTNKYEIAGGNKMTKNAVIRILNYLTKYLIFVSGSLTFK